MAVMMLPPTPCPSLSLDVVIHSLRDGDNDGATSGSKYNQPKRTITMNTPRTLKMTAISMDTKPQPIAMASTHQSFHYEPKYGQNQIPKSGVTITASPTSWMTMTTVAICTLSSANIVPHSPGHTGTCVCPMCTMAKCADI